MTQGVIDNGECLRAISVIVMESGTKHCWIEIVLQEGKNREIRRMLNALGIGVLQLIRMQIGPLTLGNLEKGGVRHLTESEVQGLRQGRSTPSLPYRGSARRRKS